MFETVAIQRKTLIHYFYIAAVTLFVIALLVVGFVMDKEDLQNE